MEKLTILVINRPTKKNENVVKDIFNVYGRKYDLLIFPPEENSVECLIQAVSFKFGLRDIFSEIFNQYIDHENDDDDFYDFDLEEIELDIFYDMLGKRFEVETFNLTDIKK